MPHRFFVEGAHEVGETVTLAAGDAHKIVAVLRLRAGDEIEIIDSAAQRFRASVQIDGRTVSAALGERTAQAQRRGPEIVVAQGIPKGQKMDFVVEKLTELGAAEIVPLRSERTVVSDVSPNKLERWKRLARAAAAQCGRSDIPHVAQPADLTELMARFGEFDLVLLPWEVAPEEPLARRLPQMLSGARRVLVVIGPEGGFSHAEADAAAAAGANIISLGPRVLRTETAGLVTLSILSFASGV